MDNYKLAIIFGKTKRGNVDLEGKVKKVGDFNDGNELGRAKKYIQR